MRVHYFQHVPFEDPANILDWAVSKGHALSRTRFFAGDSPPRPEDYDFLVVMGGPMNIYEEKDYPWLANEKHAISQAVEADKIVLGLCLGAQLIADVLGGPVTRNPVREIGWFPADLTAQASRSPIFKDFPKRFMAYHWHGDTFAIPPGSLHIASTPGCANQAFEYDGRVVGLQFHLETSAESMERLIANCAEEITDGPYIQSAETMRAGQNNIEGIKALMLRLLDGLEEEYGPK